MKRTLFRRRQPKQLKGYPISSFQTERIQVVFDNRRIGITLTGGFTWQPCPPSRSEFGPWTPLARKST